MLKLHYCRANNFGDAINPILVERLTGQKCIYAGKHSAKVVGIGSILNGFTRPRFGKTIADLFSPSASIWTSGFIKEVPWHESIRKNIRFAALRGKITLARMEKIVGHKIDTQLGDGGLLFEYLIDKKPTKKYALGLTPHCADLDNPIWQKILDNFPNSVLINFRDEPLGVLHKISECDFILSSAMHGLIAADSLNIPNQWLQLTKLTGDDYKFKDYYSVFNIEPKQLYASDISNGIITQQQINELTDNYPIKHQEVEKIQKNLLQALLSACQ
jgi:hypothetical protein